MIIVGLTGSFGTGKTTVAEFFRKLGAKIIDADKITHNLLRVNTKIYKSIIKDFGRSIFKKNSLEIDRKILAKIVFKDKKSLKKINRLIHPEVINRIKKEIRGIRARGSQRIIVIDAPLLIESGLLNLVDKLVVVCADKKTQFSRIRKSKKIADREIKLRIKAQMPLSKKIKSADYVIDNNGSLTYTKKQAKEIWRELKLKNGGNRWNR